MTEERHERREYARRIPENPDTREPGHHPGCSAGRPAPEKPIKDKRSVASYIQAKKAFLNRAT